MSFKRTWRQLLRQGTALLSASRAHLRVTALSDLESEHAFSSHVEILWMNRAFPVEGLTVKIFFEAGVLPNSVTTRVCTSLRPSLRLIGNDDGVQFTPLPISRTTRAVASTVSTAVHRFEELIGGHPYLIEVAAVANDRWRARIVRIPGVPTALMPFYGLTPDEAAGRLRQWLTRAHEPSGGIDRA